jgi:hypothetical protein
VPHDELVAWGIPLFSRPLKLNADAAADEVVRVTSAASLSSPQ